MNPGGTTVTVYIVPDIAVCGVWVFLLTIRDYSAM